MLLLPASALVALVASSAGPAAAAQMTSDDMGPAAFMWPPERVWSAAADNTAPCGSVAGVSNRTKFPLKSGKVSLVAQNESWDAMLSISYLAEPKANSDFSTLIDATAFREMDPGHTCVPVQDAPRSVKAGANATLQIKYLSEFDKPEKETFYACADITYVELSDFATSIPCFNASRHEPKGKPNAGGGNAGLSGGAIAGIVIGSLVGVAALAAAALLVYRRHQRHQRALRQQHSARGVKWDEQPGRDSSNSRPSVRLHNLSS